MTITDKIIELVPEKKLQSNGHEVLRFTDKWEPYSITLADVLRAIGNVSHDHEYGDAVLKLLNLDCCVSSHVRGAGSQELWNLSTDLEGQREETKAFIGRILGV